MKLKVFAVYDQKAAAYLTPFYFRKHGEAIRAWIDVVNDPQTNFSKYPEDYTLFELAEYDEATGKFENHLTPMSHGKALEYHNKTRQMSMAAAAAETEEKKD